MRYTKTKIRGESQSMNLPIINNHQTRNRHEYLKWLIGLMLIFIVMSPLKHVSAGETEEQEEAINTTWVYDETQSLSPETIEYITQLNQNELEEVQYGVYITDSIDIDYNNMDSYKKDIFNRLGVGNKETNQGILFVLATADREYGLEIGDGFTGQLRRELEKDFVSDIALQDLKNSDWDSAVMKVSSHIKSLTDKYAGQEVGKGQNVGTQDVGQGLLNTMTDSSDSIFKALLFSPFFIGLVVVVAITVSVIKDAFSEESKKRRAFLKSVDYKKYKRHYHLEEGDTASIQVHFLYPDTELSVKEIYRYIVRGIHERFTYTYAELPFQFVNDCLSYNYFHNLKYKNIQQMEEEVQSSIDYQLTLQEDWITEIISDDEFQQEELVDLVIEEMRDKGYVYHTELDFLQWFTRVYRGLEVRNRLEKFAKVNPDLDVDNIMYSLQETQVYKDYISGTSDTFQPTDEQIKESEYFQELEDEQEQHLEEYQKSSFTWYWLWIYSMNHQTHANAQRARRNSSARSTSTFGGGFGGGFSSGGGFSGKF